MAFNGQGQWKQSEWTAFSTWATSQLNSSTDKRLHLLRFKSAITRRRLAALIKTLPPNFDANVKQASLAFTSTFKGEWTPETFGDGQRPLALVPTKAPKAATGVETQGVKSAVNRELRAIEYYEHLIQKTRFELQKIEDEIYWLECSGKKVSAHIATVTAQFSDPEYRENLVTSDTYIRHEFTDPINPVLGQQFFLGTDLVTSNQSAPQVTNAPTQFDSYFFKKSQNSSQSENNKTTSSTGS